MQTLVIGHKNPDMDAICSAIAYAEFKKATGMPEVVAARCGNTNERINYALEKFGFESPLFVPSVQPRIEDVMERDIVYAGQDEPVYEAMTRIGESRYRGLPVVDKERRCVGLISGFKISQYLFPPRDKIGHSREVRASLKNIAETIGGNILSGQLESETLHFILVVAAMQIDTFEKRLNLLDQERTVLIVGDRDDVQRMAIEAGVHALIVTGHHGVDAGILELAKQKGTVILDSPHDTATTLLLARSAVRAIHMIYEDFVSLSADQPLEEAQREVALSPQFAFPVVDGERRVVGVISKSDFLKPIPRRLILVDHNELTQAVDGAGQVTILEVVDHHRIGALATDMPILFLNRPVGSSCTIVASLFKQFGVPVSSNLAGLMMSGVISDTLNLTSPTTTDVDREIMAELSKLSGVDPAELASEIFSVGSPLRTMTPEQAITADCKEFKEKGMLFSAAQIEELSFAPFEEKKPYLLQALEDYRAKNNYFFCALLVTNVHTQNSILLVRGAKAFTKLINYPEHGEGAWELDGVVSRKKQLLPYLASLLARAV